MGLNKMENATQKMTIDNKELAARMLAVQALYQALQTGVRTPEVAREFLDTRIGMILEEGEMVRPDTSLFSKIMKNVHERMADIDEIAKSCMSKKTEEGVKSAETEPLLKAILLCGVCELLCHTSIDVPIIINDYLDVTHCFYEKSQVSFVNGVFDSAFKAIRQSSF